MNTPIVDFVRKYAESGMSRFHMPGHKGRDFLGIEGFDITEIKDADVLSQASGIIKMSEENASSLFSSAHSFYVTQGSSTAICAMLALVKKSESEKTVVLAARNVHKAFVNACALLDIEIEWLMPKDFSTVLKCELTAQNVEEKLKSDVNKFAAVYLTSPDYLGNIQNIPEISGVCKKYEVPLLVDNAHGAYLKFLEESMHPIDLGADVCCDSAHKTLPVLTGGAYLHVAKTAPKNFAEDARGKIALFSSTSPSYLILQSLDLCNAYLDTRYREELSECVEKIKAVKQYISKMGFVVLKSEPLKIVIDAKKSGWSGENIAEVMREHNAEPEFYDDDFIVLMITPQNCEQDYERLEDVFRRMKPRTAIEKECDILMVAERAVSVREAVFSPSETIDVDGSLGRICAELTVSCPPAVPIVVSGERIDNETIKLLKKYGMSEIKVVR